MFNAEIPPRSGPRALLTWIFNEHFGEEHKQLSRLDCRSTASYVNNSSVRSRLTLQVPQFANAEKCPVTMRQIIKHGKPTVEEMWLILFFQTHIFSESID